MDVNRLNIETIKDLFSGAVYRRGLKYFKEGRVKDLSFDPDRQIWTAKVRGTKSYQVEIEDDEAAISSHCNCPAYDQYWEPCKHIAAVLLKIYESENPSFFKKGAVKRNQNIIDVKGERADFLEKRRQDLERQRQETQSQYFKQLTNDFIRSISNLSINQEVERDHQQTKSELMVEWILKINPSSYSNSQLLTVEMKVGLKRTYVVKKIKEFLQTIDRKAQYPFTSKYSYDPTEQAFAQNDQEIIHLLMEAIHYENAFDQFRPSYYQSSALGDERSISIPPLIADEFLRKLNYTSFHFENGSERFNHIVFRSNELPFSLKLDKGETAEDFQLDLQELSKFQNLRLYGYIIEENFFYKITPDQQLFLSEIKKLVDRAQVSILPLSNDQIEPFLSQVVPVYEKLGNLEISDKVASKIVKFPLQAKVFVDFVEDVLAVTLEFHYGDYKMDPFKPLVQEKGEPIILRDTEKETAIMAVIEDTSLKYNDKGLYVEDEEGIFEFLYETIPTLEIQADIFLTSAVKSLLVPEWHAPVTNIEVNSSGDWLEIGFDMEGIEPEEIKQILQSVVEKKKYYRLPDGAFVSLESEEFQTVQNMIQEFHIQPQQLNEHAIKLPIYKGVQLNEMMGQETGGQVKYGKQFRRLLKRLKSPDELDFEVPDTLIAELRDYQNHGFQWLKTLDLYKLGGILADDMGLGKTLQAIAFILARFTENQELEPALVVAPASLVYNWKNECKKFAPSLTVDVLIGSPQERMEKLQTDPKQQPQVWVTSYPTLRQDIEQYQSLSFSTLILDEAQSIKNYATKTAKAVREIQAETRFALSGTPIENSVDELWSIFQTIMPHFFPAQKVFRQIEPEKISLMVRPFLLRRLKKDVLKELPDKIETVNYSELTKEQKELYAAYLERIQRETRESLQKDGFQKSQIKILAGLTRLRQLCCHPSLFLENYQGDSGKLDQLMEIVGNAIENGRRLLIFSQFTSMLSIIREKLSESGQSFFYLDGQTAPKDRVDMVDEFNQGSGDIFLISLKAGNTGLNLTGADTVILYDLWWNPAVEEQAAGRAHRIGQKNVVQVIRLITQGTIEEKIYELQQQKKELIDTVIQSGDHAAISKMTEEEIREILNI